MAGLACLGAAAAGPAMAAAPSAGAGGWGKAIQVPGTAALNKGGVIGPSQVSCVASGFCAAGGAYEDRSERPQAFVVTGAHGQWHQAIEVPGTAALNTGRSAETSSVSCTARGSCAAGGSYSDGPGSFQAFVVTEANGRWRQAIEVPGTAALNTGGFANVTSVSCAATGNCAAVGFYTGGSHFGHAFVVTETNGRWHNAIEAPALPALNSGRSAAAESVSCPSAGNCAAVGFYNDSSGGTQAFVVSEANGRWHNAIEVPGTAALNKGGAEVSSVTCTGAGSCVAGGSYTDRSHFVHAFLVTEANGRWRTEIEVPGLAALSKDGPNSGINSVSCTAAGGCAAIGGYVRSGRDHAFVVSKP